jgi:hypothetical protein
MQRDRGVNDETISQYYEANITTGERLTNEVWPPLVGNVSTTRYFTREDTGSLGKHHIPVALGISRNTHGSKNLALALGSRYSALNGAANTPSTDIND